MTITVTSPATLFELAEMAGWCTALEWEIIRNQAAAGETFAARAGDRLILVAGYYPLPEASAEIWFNALPGAAPHMLAIVRAARLTMVASPYSRTVTLVRSPAGARIARALGFERWADTALGELWQWQKSCLATRPESSSRKPSAAALPSSPPSRASSTRPPSPDPAPAAAEGC